jgi:hypothetical protein
MLVGFAFVDVSARKHDFVIFVEPPGLGLIVLVLAVFLVEVPEVESLISTARDEAGIVFEPLDVVDVVFVLVEVEMRWRLHRVELVYKNAVSIVNGEQMATISKLNLLCVLNFDRVIVLKLPIQYVEHLNFVLETDNKMQSRWVQRKTLSWLVKRFANVHAEVVFVRPHPDCSVRTASRK